MRVRLRINQAARSVTSAIATAAKRIPLAAWAIAANRKIVTRNALSLFRSRRFFRAALLRHAVALVSSLMGLVIIFSLFRNDASAVIAIGKPLTAAVAVLGLIGEAFIAMDRYKARHENFRARMARNRRRRSVP